MRLSIASSALAAFVLTPVVAGYAPALCQDFSITNHVEPANAWRRDDAGIQAWWGGMATIPDTHRTAMRGALSKSIW